MAKEGGTSGDESEWDYIDPNDAIACPAEPPALSEQCLSAARVVADSLANSTSKQRLAAAKCRWGTVADAVVGEVKKLDPLKLLDLIGEGSYPVIAPSSKDE